MLEFFRNHLELCITVIYMITMLVFSVISFLVTFIVLLCKKTKLVDNDLLEIVSELPDLIIAAEKTGATGLNKYAHVLSSALDHLAVLKNKTVDEVASKYASFIDKSIENILSTPTKKGDFK